VIARTSVIEVVGPPGAGKSALAGALSNRHDVVVVKDHELRDVPALVLSAATATLVLRAGVPGGVSTPRWLAWAARLRAAPAVAARHAESGARVVAFDQGPAYTLARMSMLEGSASAHRWWYAQAAATARLLDALVVLDADLATLVTRVRSRSKAHVCKGLDKPDARRYLDTERRRAEQVVDVLDRAGCTVVRIDSGHIETAAQVREVMAVLERVRSSAAGEHR
jgi:deoxyadenosine/deoxycytidine kinase